MPNKEKFPYRADIGVALRGHRLLLAVIASNPQRRRLWKEHGRQRQHRCHILLVFPDNMNGFRSVAQQVAQQQQPWE